MIVPEDDEMIIKMEYQADFLNEELLEEQEFYVFDYNENFCIPEIKIEYDDIKEEDVKIEEEEEEIVEEIEEHPTQIIIRQETHPFNSFDQDSSSCTTQLNYEVKVEVKIEVKVKIEDGVKVEENVEVESEDQFEPYYYFESQEIQWNYSNMDISESGDSMSEESDSDIVDICQHVWLIQPTGLNKFILYDCFTKYQLSQDKYDQSDYQNPQFYQYSAQKTNQNIKKTYILILYMYLISSKNRFIPQIVSSNAYFENINIIFVGRI
ncbi:hypothetical protein pb186bvf_002030 [Paramecium bursaria]